MEDFKNFKENIEIEKIIEERDIVNMLTEEEHVQMILEFKNQLLELGISQEEINKIDEGIIGKVLGGVAGFVIGPAIGKVIARALGIEKGIMYDMLSSRLVGIALGSAISKSFGKK